MGIDFGTASARMVLMDVADGREFTTIGRHPQQTLRRWNEVSIETDQ
jgi:ribulose kinase